MGKGIRTIAMMGLLGAMLASSPAMAEVKYGPWRKTSNCEPMCMTVGFNKCALRQPAGDGVSPPMECYWERDVIDCQTWKDKLMNPKQCFTRKQRSKDRSLDKPTY